MGCGPRNCTKEVEWPSTYWMPLSLFTLLLLQGLESRLPVLLRKQKALEHPPIPVTGGLAEGGGSSSFLPQLASSE